MKRPCLGPAPGIRCPSRALTTATRCLPCNSAWHHARNQRPERLALYGPGTGWQRTSREQRAAVGICQVGGPGCTGRPDTLDHTTGLVVCLVCHRSEAQGGVFASRKVGVS